MRRALEPEAPRVYHNGRRLAVVLGLAGLVVWAVWWGVSFFEGELVGTEYTWFRNACFGCDFTTEPDNAVRVFDGGLDPYDNTDHLFHYPPIVIRLFLWVIHFSTDTALGIWFAVLAVLIAAGAVVAARVRPKLGLPEVPVVAALALVLLSYPALFAIERANFDLITLAALFVAMFLFSKERAWPDFFAGCILALGPWVKLYPGLMGLGLIGARRWKALAGFVVGGIGIGLLTPEETVHSFKILRLAVQRVESLAPFTPYTTWSHSISTALIWLAPGLPKKIPTIVLSGAAILPLAAWVAFRLYKAPRSTPLLYPSLLWFACLGSFAPAIANDYSLVFLPLVVVAVCSSRDPWAIRGLMLLLFVWWQPFALPIPALLLLGFKLAGMVGTGMTLVLRATSPSLLPGPHGLADGAGDAPLPATAGAADAVASPGAV